MPSSPEFSLPPVSLLTFVLQEHHCLILEDWLRFFDAPVQALIVHVGADPKILPRLAALCDAHDVRLCNLGTTSPRETTQDESGLLTAQIDAVEEGFGCVIRLDTIPFRRDGVTWQAEAFALMARTGACFVTGSTLPFKADRPTEDPGFLLTQRISNCFLLIEPAVWHRLQQGTPDSAARYGRYSVEGAAEDYLVAQGLWGVRLVNRPQIRVFHCQEWGARLLDVRTAFRAGRRIAPFLRGWQDDYFGAKARYYMRPGVPFPRRVRIALGRWRRQIIGR